ncbi:MAG: homogentisate 1,2-dioxygenase, partial [Betaproteobacteria bacterium]
MTGTSTPPDGLLSGFGNHFSSEAVPGALPQGRNSPQRAPLGLYAELLSGTAFTAPRAANQRTWLYRRQPSVRSGPYAAMAHALLKTGARDSVDIPPDPLRWHPQPPTAEPLDFVDDLRTMLLNGD